VSHDLLELYRQKHNHHTRKGGGTGDRWEAECQKGQRKARRCRSTGVVKTTAAIGKQREKNDHANGEGGMQRGMRDTVGTVQDRQDDVGTVMNGMRAMNESPFGAAMKALQASGEVAAMETLVELDVADLTVLSRGKTRAYCALHISS
jgi:hypothetical protein